jgi:ubiquinone/menaquinone biosynthesis C-methylase UbiE
VLSIFEREPVHRERYQNMVRALAPWAHLLRGKEGLDFGCSWGISSLAAYEAGARRVVGVEVLGERIPEGNEMLSEAGFSEQQIHLLHVPDTRKLPFEDEAFDFVLAQAVLEHIPQPRHLHLREMWRVLRPGGHMIIAETPNKYYPKEIHTTKLWFNHWLPEPLAFWRAVKFGKGYRDYVDPEEWTYSGWRGMGYYEMVKPLGGGYTLVPELENSRHKLLNRLGIPASILDPYPVWVLRKNGK